MYVPTDPSIPFGPTNSFSATSSTQPVHHRYSGWLGGTVCMGSRLLDGQDLVVRVAAREVEVCLVQSIQTCSGVHLLSGA